MFTGIIEEIGVIKSITQQEKDYQLMITSHTLLSDVKIGDSIAVNGVCLTVTRFSHENFWVDMMPETLKATGLALAKIGTAVNLERALRADSRLGGHFVSGHVDCVGEIMQRSQQNNAIYLSIKIPREYLKFFILKGSVALDGTSLTVFGVDDKHQTITVSLIPHTARQTILGQKKQGDCVNVECDVLAKYLQRLTQFPINSAYHDADKLVAKPSTGVTNELLHRAGFI